MVSLIIQFPFKDLAEYIDQKLYKFYGPMFDAKDVTWKIVHGKESDTWGIVIKPSDWYDRKGIRTIFLGLTEPINFCDLEVLVFSGSKKLIDILPSRYLIPDENGAFEFSENVRYNPKTETVYYDSRRIGANLIHKLNGNHDPELSKGIQRIQLLGLYTFNDYIWKEVFTPDILEY